MPSSSSITAGDEALSGDALPSGQSSFTLQLGQFENVTSTHPWQSGQL
jgi:hypothetical protein